MSLCNDRSDYSGCQPEDAPAEITGAVVIRFVAHGLVVFLKVLKQDNGAYREKPPFFSTINA